MVSYVMLQGKRFQDCQDLNAMLMAFLLLALGLMPLQLLNLGPLFSLAFARAFWTKTPRGSYPHYRFCLINQ